MHAPIVGSPGGSSASIWPAGASRRFSSESRIPASTVQVRSPASCSMSRPSWAVESTTSPPSRPIETVVPASAAARMTSAASCTLAISETLGKACLLERVGAVGPRHLAAEPWRREHLARVREPVRVERATQPRHRLEVLRPEEERHRANLVEPDPVLAGDRAAGIDARLEDRLGERRRPPALALHALVVEDERRQVPVAPVEDARDAQPVLAFQLG